MELKIPFVNEFKHNTAKRNCTQTVIVVASNGQLNGFGEGCPREYVTGESISSAIQFFNQIKTFVLDEINDLASLKYFRKKNNDQILKNHSAWCAIELAILDLFAKQDKCSCEKLLGLPELSGSFHYTAVIGDEHETEFKENAVKYLELGMSDFKIKISGNVKEDYKKMIILKELNEGCKIRLDANNLWDKRDEVMTYINGLPCEITGIEEPLRSKKIEELISLGGEINVPIILDESFYHCGELENILQNKELFIINLRVSKMGGLLNSLRIADICKNANLRVIVGAQVGETSILTRAGLSVANYLRPDYVGIEGGYGTYLLEKDIVVKSLMFGSGGLLSPNTLLNQELFGFQLDLKVNALIH